MPTPETPGDAPPFSPGDWLATILAGLIALGVYLATAAPSVTGEDSGELIAAAYALGIPHPPGYPLWCLLGHVFIRVLPFGSVAWRVNAMSAAFGAATALLVCLLILRLTRNRFASLCGALALAFSLEFWQQSVIAEVYTLNAFFVALCLLLLLLWAETLRPRFVYALGVAYGLSVCNHASMYLLGPLFLLFVVAVDRRPRPRARAYLAAAGFAGMAFCLQLYLPIRSLADPPIDWGNPENAPNFWAVLTRQQYAFMLTERPRTLERFVRQMGVFLTFYSKQFTQSVGWIAAAGALALWRKRFAYTTFMFVTFCALVLGTVCVLNFSFDEESLWVTSVHWIPAYAIAAVWLGAAVDWVGNHPSRERLCRVLSALCGSSIVLWPLLAHYAANDRSDDYFAHDYAKNVLATFEKNALYFPSADHANFPLQYFQVVQGLRPDVTIGSKYGYTDPALYTDIPADLRIGIGKYPTRSQCQRIEEWIAARAERPVYFSKPRPLETLPGKSLVQTGLLFRLVDENAAPLERDLWADYSWHTLEPEAGRDDYAAKLILFDYYMARARDHFTKGRPDEAFAAIAKAERVAGRNADLLNDLGGLLGERGFPDEAAGYFASVLAIDPGHDLAARNLARTRARTAQ